MNATFTVVLGVAGRLTLVNMLDSLARNLGQDDQVIVVVDSFEYGSQPETHRLVHSYGERFECYAYDSGYHFLGVEQMNYAFREVPMRGSHVLALADDDVVVDGAFDTYRRFCEPDMTCPLLPRFLCPFGIDFRTGAIDVNGRCILWDVPRMARVRITSSIVVPKPFLQMWQTKIDPCVDYDWMLDILAKSPQPVWLDYVSIIARPERRGNDVVHQGIWQCDTCKVWGYVEDGQIACCNRPVRTGARVMEGLV